MEINSVKFFLLVPSRIRHFLPFLSLLRCNFNASNCTLPNPSLKNSHGVKQVPLGNFFGTECTTVDLIPFPKEFYPVQFFHGDQTLSTVDISCVFQKLQVDVCDVTFVRYNRAIHSEMTRALRLAFYRHSWAERVSGVHPKRVFRLWC